MGDNTEFRARVHPGWYVLLAVLIAVSVVFYLRSGGDERDRLTLTYTEGPLAGTRFDALVELDETLAVGLAPGDHEGFEVRIKYSLALAGQPLPTPNRLIDGGSTMFLYEVESTKWVWVLHQARHDADWLAASEYAALGDIETPRGVAWADLSDPFP